MLLKKSVAPPCYLNRADPLTTAQVLLECQATSTVLVSFELITAPAFRTASSPPDVWRPHSSLSPQVPTWRWISSRKEEEMWWGGSALRSHSCCSKVAEKGLKVVCVLCLNISHLQSRLMNNSDGAIYSASHLKHLPRQPLCWAWLRLCPATGSF